MEDVTSGFLYVALEVQETTSTGYVVGVVCMYSCNGSPAMIGLPIAYGVICTISYRYISACSIGTSPTKILQIQNDVHWFNV